MIVAVRQYFRGESDGNPDAGVLIEELETGWHHPDYGVTYVVEQDIAAGDVAIRAVPVLPQTMTDDGDIACAGLFIGGEKPPSHDRFDAEQWKEAGGYSGGRDLPRLAVTGQIESARFDRGHRLGGLIFRPTIRAVSRSRASLNNDDERRLFPNHHQSVRLAIRRRLEQNGIDHTENSRVRADAERQRQHGDEGEAGALHQRSRAVAQVLNQRLDKIQTPHLAAHLP